MLITVAILDGNRKLFYFSVDFPLEFVHNYLLFPKSSLSLILRYKNVFDQTLRVEMGFAVGNGFLTKLLRSLYCTTHIFFCHFETIKIWPYFKYKQCLIIRGGKYDDGQNDIGFYLRKCA